MPSGVERSVSVPPQMSALDMLRDRIGLTGTKYACGEGECGACTISVDGQTVNSCLMFAADCDGRELVTIEGLVTSPLGETLRKSFSKYGAVQCGFCTPGQIMAIKGLLNTNPNPTPDEIRVGVSGNICRCGCYPEILQAVLAAAKVGK